MSLASPIEVDVWVILRRHSPNALKLAAANADDRHPDFIVKLGITLHLQQFNLTHRAELFPYACQLLHEAPVPLPMQRHRRYRFRPL